MRIYITGLGTELIFDRPLQQGNIVAVFGIAKTDSLNNGELILQTDTGDYNLVKGLIDPMNTQLF
jgi:hypothetical protein